MTACRPSVWGVTVSLSTGGITTASPTAAVYPPSRPTMPRTVARNPLAPDLAGDPDHLAPNGGVLDTGLGQDRVGRIYPANT